MRPEEYQPPLTWWSHLWRLGLMLLISAASTLPTFAAKGWPVTQLVVDLVIGVACFVLVWWRRRHPVLVATGTNLATLVSLSAAGPSALALVSLATRRRWREVVVQASLAVACGITHDWWLGTEPTATDPLYLRYGLFTAATAVAVAWGLYIGSRRELLATWRFRAMAAEAERDAEVARAQAAERSRIAREMHDVLAHRISTVSMHAGALAYRTDLPPETVQETARTIEQTSRLALTELREVLGVLREGPGDADPEAPQAGFADLEDLIDENRRHGMSISAVWGDDLTGLSPATCRTLYRCLQEALTNARKHAPATAVAVRLSGTPESGVDLLVDNPLPLRDLGLDPPRSGLGLVGLAERVALRGGRQSVTRTDDRHFVLHVWLPWQS